MNRTQQLRLLVFSACLLASRPLLAQEPQAETVASGSEIGFHVGPLLPNQVEGMTEIQPMWGPRYSMAFRKGFLEASFANSRANGVIYYNGFMSYRYDITIEGMTALLYAGLDFHQWSSPPEDTTRMVGGGHVGGGMQFPVGDSMWFRSEMKFNLNPGTALYIGFGFMIRMPDGGGGGGAE
ncbi:MAG: hypothetical protein AB7F59_07350 [Bdellovibrionales bacterium]